MSDLPRRASYDLHMHSSCSDGRFEPEEVLERAARGGLDVIALTDHDLIGGLDPGVHRCGDRLVRVVAGAELTGSHEGQEYHLLVYFAGEPPTAFRDLCRAQTRARARRYDAAVHALGIAELTPAPAHAHHGELALTRHHLGRALVALGHADHVGEAIRTFAGRDTVPLIDLPFVECIRVARALGGVTSWAHPPRQALIDHTPTFAAAGLHALEALRPHTRRADRVLCKKLARRFGLFFTGGSDWHGWRGASDLGMFQLRGDDLDPFRAALAA